MVTMSVFKMAGNVPELTEGREFNHKTILGAVNPCFWLGAVMPSCFFKIKMYDKYLFSRQTKRFGANKN